MRLDASTVAADPVTQFRRWLDDARGGHIHEPHAMTLATVTPEGRPAARMVLLRGLDERGFVFYTNYESAKGRDLAAIPFAAATFYWEALGRQVRVEGPVARIDAAESDAYFAQRPRGHQLGAWASAQSTVVRDRASLERAMAETESRFADRDVDRPAYWGGYRIVPERIEFWQHRDDRLHDRIRYVRDHGAWRIERLSP
jgi:pyridoxamine 5'-phosphate oxidase